ncbi:unnamed protein product [Medioppia subpectinata]|uniref:Uncharacterized protein n=1 Tax=Medioppia subpectinata TaxID=1979941 RepID=A0A7R9KWK4_9ACAR|nr:unnamed protein product [Medioppia subpectinata]CAG2111170.1 unnamed protein product [Medioppia subpectinata]
MNWPPTRRPPKRSKCLLLNTTVWTPKRVSRRSVVTGVHLVSTRTCLKSVESFICVIHSSTNRRMSSYTKESHSYATTSLCSTKRGSYVSTTRPLSTSVPILRAYT